MFRDVQGGMTKAEAARKHGLHPSEGDRCCRSGERLEKWAIAVSTAMTDAASGVPFKFPVTPKYTWPVSDIDTPIDKYGWSWRQRLEQVYREMEHQRRLDAGEYAVKQSPPAEAVMQACETW